MGCGSTDYIKRNVVLGDTIQTDYTEIRIRHFQKNWIHSRNEEENLLITLGLLFARALSEELNVERTDLDFTITPNGHICIFDANPGGSGYSNQLAAMDLMKSVIERAYTIIEAAIHSGNKEALIDKFTLHYLNHIDIDAAKAWIEEERSARKVLPNAVLSVLEKVLQKLLLPKWNVHLHCHRTRSSFSLMMTMQTGSMKALTIVGRAVLQLFCASWAADFFLCS